ncbi:MAG: TldD/PmbA family protein [Candidatus Heimdallarchaeota archaeon]|nr:TldD/PmbA family protein [Candidatus Heimdallarchaeota archaeon]
MDNEFIFDLLHKAVKHGEEIGASFIEARLDNLSLTTINYTNEIITESSTRERKGIGIIAYVDDTVGYSFTPVLTTEAVKETTKRAAKIAKASAFLSKEKETFDERDAVKDIAERKVVKHPKDVEFDEKIEMLKRSISAIKENIEPTSTTAVYGELWGDKYFVNSEGSEIYWNPLILDMRTVVTKKVNGFMARGNDGVGSSQGLEFFENEPYTPETFGNNAGKYCKEQESAVSAPAGKTAALIGPRLGGVLAHESFGHLSESDFVMSGMSPIADRIGATLGTEHATIYDTGLTSKGGLWLPYDDSGTPTDDTIILDKGILVGYLHNRVSAKRMNTKPTGNSRAITYMFDPIPRMKNTYFGAGELTEEEAIEMMGDGIYAIGTSGGQADMDGSFLFKCSRGYLVEKGEVTKTIKDAALTGNILEFIKRIKGATKNIEMFTGYFGGCGKGGQYPLPVGMGGPILYADEVMVGGEK